MKVIYNWSMASKTYDALTVFSAAAAERVLYTVLMIDHIHCSNILILYYITVLMIDPYSLQYYRNTCDVLTPFQSYSMLLTYLIYANLLENQCCLVKWHNFQIKDRITGKFWK